MLKIGDFSKLSRVSIRMLRHYDEIGLLIPAAVDSFTGYRYYGEDQLAIASRITMLKQMGFGLAAIAEILKNYDDPQVLEQYLRVKQIELQEQAEETANRMQLLEKAMQRLRKDGTIMNYSITQKELPERYVASVRGIIPTYAHEGMLWKMLADEIAPLHVQIDEPCYASAVFHDGEYKECDADVEVQEVVKGRFENTQNVVFKVEPSVLVASATYQGIYEKIDEVNAAIAAWVRDNGYIFDGPMFNIYHVGPANTQNPEKYVTEVCYPIKKK